MRKSAILWLIPGLLFGLITLAGIGVGGYYVNQAHTQVVKFEKDVDDAKAAHDKAKNAPMPDAGRINKLSHDVHVAEVDTENAKRDRIIAATVSSTVVIPGLLALVFMVMAVMRFMQKPKPPKDADDDEDEEEADDEDAEEEKVPIKKKAAAKPKDDDDEA